jgi:intracellular septation protein
MQAVLAFAPLVAFFVAYSLRGLYTATAVLMVAMVVLLLVDWLRTRRIPPMHALSTALVMVFGGATLVLHNTLFIQWKLTILCWLVSIAFLATFWIGDRTLAQRFLGPALEGQLQVSEPLWRRVNGASALFYAALGFLNLAFVYGASERTWVYFKMFGVAILIFAFVALQVLWLHNRATPVPEPAASSPQAPP